METPDAASAPSVQPRVGHGQILSETSSMPGSSFSLPAKRTCPGLLITPTSVCGACYADERKRYRWRIVKDAQDRRLAWTMHALTSRRFAPVVTELIFRRDERHFRLHDSGDFFSPPYVDAWYEVALALPTVAFWAPTRSWALNGQLRPDCDPLLTALRRLASLPNVTVRPSALLIDGDPPVIPGLHAGSSVTTNPVRATCPKYLRSPQACGDCRRCWADSLNPVIYLKH